MLVKNDEIELNISAIGNEGEGIGKSDEGITVFVPGAVCGDRIIAHITKVKKTYAYGIVKQIVSPSPYRVEPKCPVALKCGGCTLQQLSYEEQLKYKENKVRDCIERIGGIANPPMEPIVGADNIYFYRNKAQFPVGTGKDGKPVIGFYRHHSHDVVENTECAIQAPVNGKIMEAVRNHMLKNDISAYNEETGKGLVRHVYTRVGFVSKEVMVCIVINGDKLPKSEELCGKLSDICREENMSLESVCLNVNREKTNVILGKKNIVLQGREYITDKIGEVSFKISPLSFYQVNPEQTKKLYNLAAEFAGLTGNETVWDLYCGIGTISLYLAGKAKRVYGVEIVPEAIENAKENAKLNGIENAEFFVGASEDVAPTLPKNPDVIVVDPPRKGCDEKLLETIIVNNPKRVVYVSCDPATLARDLKYLVANGYTLDRVRPVDQFCHSGHVETVCQLNLGDGGSGSLDRFTTDVYNHQK